MLVFNIHCFSFNIGLRYRPVNFALMKNLILFDQNAYAIRTLQLQKNVHVIFLLKAIKPTHLDTQAWSSTLTLMLDRDRSLMLSRIMRVLPT